MSESATKPRVVAILGPTASGKAKLAAAVARLKGSPLLSCDSMKVYRQMDVGTAKPSATVRAGVDWHGLDLVWPWESYNASRFCELFESLLEQAASEGKPLLISGGTMLYFKAATEGLGEVPPRDPKIRAALLQEAEAGGSGALHERLSQVDPVSARRVHPNDLRRIVRALEVYQLSSRPLSAFQGQFGKVREGIQRQVFVLQRERSDMDQRIDRRVKLMMEKGWIDEARRLLTSPEGVSHEASQALGYRQIFAWLNEGEPVEEGELTVRIQSATRRFARKQLTWLRHLEGAYRLELKPGEDSLQYVDRVRDALVAGPAANGS